MTQAKLTTKGVCVVWTAWLGEADLVIIDSRFNGPPGSGNGGYCAGLVASRVGAAAGVEVTLRKPPPLDTELTVVDGQTLRVYAGGVLIAEALPRAIGTDEVVPPVPLAEAEAAAATYRGFVEHPFPTCFVCGPARPDGDGLRLFPGTLPDGRTAAPFLVPDDISEVIMWAALDCPGGWAAPLESRAYVLGRIAARVDALPDPGDPCVVMGQLITEDGRKAYTRSSVYSATGALLGTARATWIAL